MGHTANDLENFDFGTYGLGHGGVANVDRSNSYWPPADNPPKFSVKLAYYLSPTLLCNRASSRKLPMGEEQPMR